MTGTSMTILVIFTVVHISLLRLLPTSEIEASECGLRIERSERDKKVR